MLADYKSLHPATLFTSQFSFSLLVCISVFIALCQLFFFSVCKDIEKNERVFKSLSICLSFVHFG